MEEIRSGLPRRRPGVGPPPAAGWPPPRRPFILLNKVEVSKSININVRHFVKVDQKKFVRVLKPDQTKKKMTPPSETRPRPVAAACGRMAASIKD